MNLAGGNGMAARQRKAMPVTGTAKPAEPHKKKPAVNTHEVFTAGRGFKNRCGPGSQKFPVGSPPSFEPNAPHTPYGLVPETTGWLLGFPESMVLLMKRTEPSASSPLTPPGCWLSGGAITAVPHSEPSFVQTMEFGGKIVLQPLGIVGPHAQWTPRMSPMDGAVLKMLVPVPL